MSFIRDVYVSYLCVVWCLQLLYFLTVTVTVDGWVRGAYRIRFDIGVSVSASECACDMQGIALDVEGRQARVCMRQP